MLYNHYLSSFTLNPLGIRIGPEQLRSESYFTQIPVLDSTAPLSQVIKGSVAVAWRHPRPLLLRNGALAAHSLLTPTERALMRARAEEGAVKLDAREEQPLPPLEAGACRGGPERLEPKVAVRRAHTGDG